MAETQAEGSMPDPASIAIARDRIRQHPAGERDSFGHGGASVWSSKCLEHQKASLKCIEQNYGSKSTACRDLFEQYKACRRDEHAEILRSRNPDGRLL